MNRLSVLVSPPFQSSAYQNLLAETGKTPAELFVDLALPVVKRYCAQTSFKAEAQALFADMLRDVWQFSLSLGHPRALGNAEMGEPGDPHADVWSERTRVLLRRWRLSKSDEEMIAPLVQQLLLALLLPEFKACRQSYLEKEPLDGCIPRQDAGFCKDRISGSHCEDCPYFTALSGEKHRKLLERSWEKGAAAFTDHAQAFLPDDFRYLRVFLHLHRRYS